MIKQSMYMFSPLLSNNNFTFVFDLIIKQHKDEEFKHFQILFQIKSYLNKEDLHRNLDFSVILLKQTTSAGMK